METYKNTCENFKRLSEAVKNSGFRTETIIKFSDLVCNYNKSTFEKTKVKP